MTDELGARPELLRYTHLDASVPEPPAIVDTQTGEVLPTDSDGGISPDLAKLYENHSRELGRIAFLLTTNFQDAEDVVADVFVRIAERYDLRTIEDPLAFLRAAVVNQSRTMLRRRVVRDKALPKLLPGVEWDSTSEAAIGSAESSAVIMALRQLPMRQRQAIVLRYYADLNELEVANTMGVRRGSVKSHTARGIAALRRLLDLEQFM